MAINKLNKTFISEQILTASEMNQISQKIDELVNGVNTNKDSIPDVSGLATQTELNNKLDTATYNSEKTNFATKTELNTKLNTSTYNTDKATFALKTELSSKADRIVTESISDTTTEIQPNKYYIFGEVETLTLTLAGAEENKLTEYMFEFTSGTTPTKITDIAGVEWKGDTIEANKVYQASISRGIGILIGRAKA